MQNYSDELREFLIKIICNPKKDFLICLPYFEKNKIQRLRNTKLFNKTSNIVEEKYLHHVNKIGSPMFTRPDNTTNLMNENFFKKIQDIFCNKKVLIINFNKILLKHPIFKYSKKISFIEIAKRNCFSDYKLIKEKCSPYIKDNYDIIAISAGPTATCLSYDLCDQIQVIDIGQICRIYNQYFKVNYKDLVSQL